MIIFKFERNFFLLSLINSIMKLIYDTIHGFIHFKNDDLQFLDNRWMKRLKRIKQLGLLDHVFPSASHSRFEHVLGVYNYSNIYIDYLENNSGEYKKKKNIKKLFTDKEKRCVALAGLFHDLGHGPFSHIFDNVVLPRFCPNIEGSTHEKRSQWIVEQIFKEVQPDGFNGYDIDLIKNIIEPPESMINLDSYTGIKTYTGVEKPYMFEIVNNELNSIDVDKLDYLQRDAKHIGLDYTFDPNRIFNKSFISPTTNSIVYHKNIESNIFDMYYTRYKFHKDIYNHKTVKLIELMLGDAFIESNNVYNFCSLLNTEDYLGLDDSIYSQILFSNINSLKKSKNLLKKIEDRDLYKCHYYGEIDEYNLPDVYEQNYNKINISFNLCSGQRDPLYNVLFRDSHQKKTYYGKLSGRLVPNKFEENIVMYYSK